MKNLYMKQEVFSLRGRFAVVNEKNEDAYYVEGSFMKIPKHFKIYNQEKLIGQITKKMISLLPKFTIEIEGNEIATITKALSLFKPKYMIEAEGIVVDGNWWDMDFEIMKDREVIGRVQKKWFTFGDSYNIQVLDEAYEALIVSIVIAIDCVKADQGGNTIIQTTI